jgi:hypothetical protein
MAGAQLAGIRISNQFNSWRNELFLTTELYLYPLNDFSFTYLTDISLLRKAINLGAAVQFYRCFPVNNDYTQPSHYLANTVGPTTPRAPNYYFSEDDVAKTDTLCYTFAGTKLMARFSFDPKPLLGLDFLGGEDLKLYSEAIILGVKNYPANPEISLKGGSPTNVPINEFGYDKLMQKMPIAMGFNLPAFKLLDVIALEAEYYGKKYVNRVPVIAQGLGLMRLPLPYDPELNSGYPSGDSTVYGASRKYLKSFYYSGVAQWKWSLYAKKTLFGNFSITGQAARDHSRVQTTLASSMDQEEALIKGNQWYWMLKCGYSF